VNNEEIEIQRRYGRKNCKNIEEEKKLLILKYKGL
jgi:hypothetical protein